MKIKNSSFFAKAAVIAASIAAALAIIFKLKRDNDILSSYENEDDDDIDFGEIDSLDNINSDTSGREYISINITGKNGSQE